jgi:hypothetical protein
MPIDEDTILVSANTQQMGCHRKKKRDRKLEEAPPPQRAGALGSVVEVALVRRGVLARLALGVLLAVLLVLVFWWKLGRR